MSALYRIYSFAPSRKLYQIGALFAQKNGDHGAISVTKRSCSDLGIVDCEQSLFFFRFSESNARARERRSRETRETRAAASPVSRHQSHAWPFACPAFCSTDYRKKRDCSQSIGIVSYRIGFCHFFSQCERVNRTVAEVAGELQQRRRRPQRERQN